MDEKILITVPAVEDADTLFKWGEENYELWGDAESKWYPKEALIKWINNPRDDVLLVARVDGKLVGMCMSYNLDSWAYCAGLYVDTQFRKQGIARKLVDSAIEILKSKGIDAIVFLVDEKNTEGMKFYKKINCKEGFKFVWMYKMLTGGGV